MSQRGTARCTDGEPCTARSPVLVADSDLADLARRYDSSTNATLRIRAAYLERLATR